MSVQAEARRFRWRIRRALALRGATAGALVGLAVAGCLGLAVRALDVAGAPGALGLAMAGVGACLTAAWGLVSARAAPTLEACVAALDAAGQAGGLLMSAALPGSEAWPLPTVASPGVAWRGGGRLAACAVLAGVFCLVVEALPRHVFVRAPAGRLAIAALLEEQASRAALLEEQRLLPPQVAAALSNELARLGRAGDASDPARVLEALDHISDELRRTAQEKAESLAGERADTQAAQALAEMLAEALEQGRGSSPANPLGEAGEALAQFLSSARLPPSALSNLLSLAAAPGGLTAAAMRELAERLKGADALSAEQLAKLGEMRLVEASACQSDGSCTNGAACGEALARLLADDGPAADAALALVALCTEPGSGGVSRGRGDAMLTWTDPSTTENASFKEQAVKPGRLPDVERSHLQGLSAAAPELPAAAAGVSPGALGTEGAARGATPQTVVLPRHREAVKRFFSK
jgi:hypothetical protein